jgi:Uma2 family endonuclease
MISTALKRAARSNGHREPLENGERLTAPEFMRRYETMPRVKKAELIEGVVYMGSPVRVTVHAAPDNLIQTWLGTYSFRTPGTQAASNGTVQLDLDNVPQPDAFLRIVEACGGASRLDVEGYLVGTPELVVEIAASSNSIDLHDKLHAYRRNGVKEYLVWRTTEQAFDWMVLVEGVYQRQTPDSKGICRSVTFPGLILNVPALLAQDGAAVLAALSTALKSPAHRTFVSKLANLRTSR